MTNNNHKKLKLALIVPISIATAILLVLACYGGAKLFGRFVDTYNAKLSREVSSAGLSYAKSQCEQNNYPDNICDNLSAEASPPLGDWGGEWLAYVSYLPDTNKFSASMEVHPTINGKFEIYHYSQDEQE